MVRTSNGRVTLSVSDDGGFDPNRIGSTGLGLITAFRLLEQWTDGEL
jgi:signal transduction histidine kinase